MKRSSVVLLLALALAMYLPAGDQYSPNANGAADASEVAIGFTGGSVWTSNTTGICMWHFPVVGNLDLKSLFATDSSGAPAVDIQHSYLIWVSDFSVQFLPATPPQYLALAPRGTATIYFSANPGARDLRDRAKRSTWGEPVATFVRQASIVRTADGFASDTFIFSAALASSRPFVLNGKAFNFSDLIPNGMTCFEYGQNGSSWEAGNCVAIGNRR